MSRAANVNPVAALHDRLLVVSCYKRAHRHHRDTQEQMAKA